MTEELDVFSDSYDDNGSEYISFSMDFKISSTEPMFLYQVFQCAIIFSTLVAGVLCLLNLMFMMGTRCKNFDLLLTSFVVGSVHLLSCVLMLRLSEDSALNEIPRGGNQRCVDYFLPATISNTVVLVTLCMYIIERNVMSCVRKLLYKLLFLAPIGLGIYLLYIDLKERDENVGLHQEVFMTIESEKHAQVDFFWSICLRNLSDGGYRLLIEYGLLYGPVIVVILMAWASTCKRNKDCSIVRLQIVATDCFEHDEYYDDNDEFMDIKHSCIQIKCLCTRLNSAFVAIIIYFAVILLVFRPAMIVYGYATSGTIRDLLPSLLQTVIYCFLCSEFLLRLHRQKAYRIRKQLLVSSLGTKV